MQQHPRPALGDYENILKQFVSDDYAQVIGMYLWSVEGEIIKGDVGFESLCADLKNIKATPKELSIKLNSLRTGPIPINPLPQQSSRNNHRYSG